MSIISLPNEILLEVTKDLGLKDLSSLIKSNSRFVRPLTPRFILFALKPKYRVTALYWAAVNGREDVVRLVLEKGRNFAVKECARNYGFPDTMLYYPSSRKFSEELVQTIIEKGVSGTLIVQDDLDGTTPLHWAVRHSHDVMFKMLLEKTRLLETPDHRGWTALHQAVVEENIMAAESLLEHGAYINPSDKERNTPINLAARYGYEAMVKMLLEWEGLALNIQGSGGDIPFETAEKNGYRDIARLLLEATDIGHMAQVKGTTLHLALRYGYIDSAKDFLQKGTSVTSLDEHGNTPLHLAARYANTEIVELLLDKGSDIDIKNGDGWTPLHLAVFYNLKDNEVVERLLKRGADITLETPIGDTAFDLAKSDRDSGKLPLGLFGSIPNTTKKRVKKSTENRDSNNPNEQILHRSTIPVRQSASQGPFGGPAERPISPWRILDDRPAPRWHVMAGHMPRNTVEWVKIGSDEWKKRQLEAIERGRALTELLKAYGAESDADESEEENVREKVPRWMNPDM